MEEIREAMRLKGKGMSHAEMYRSMGVSAKRLENIMVRAKDEGIRAMWSDWSHILNAPASGQKVQMHLIKVPRLLSGRHHLSC